MRFYIKTFGCRVNQYEGEQIREAFESSSAVPVDNCYQADLCVINSCSVTDRADKDARVLIRRIRKNNPLARLVVTGCYATRASEEIAREFPDVCIVTNSEKEGLGASSISSFFAHTRAYIKVQDGCNMKCSYCIVPQVRPTMKSRLPEEVLSEIKGLFAKGYREFVLCGVRLGRFSQKDKEGRQVDLIGLVERISQIPGDFRIRLSSLEITEMTDRFLKIYKDTPKTTPYFHVPLQSGCDKTLQAMKRWYTSSFYAKRLEACRKILGSDIGVFTDFMVGFPTETESDFKESLDFVEMMEFSGLHIFRFSPRVSTPAAEMKPVYKPRELEKRLRQAQLCDRRLRERCSLRFVGRDIKVLVESLTKDSTRGRAENFLEVLLPKNKINSGCWETVKIDAAQKGKLVVER